MKVLNDLKQLRIGIELFRQEHDGLPSLDRYSQDLEPYLKSLFRTNAAGFPIDRWDRPLMSRVPGKHQAIDVYSVGVDGVDDGGERDDISCWTGINDGYYEKRSWPAGRFWVRFGPYIGLSSLLLLRFLPWRIVVPLTGLVISLILQTGYTMLLHPAVVTSHNGPIRSKIMYAGMAALACFVFLAVATLSHALKARHRPKSRTMGST